MLGRVLDTLKPLRYVYASPNRLGSPDRLLSFPCGTADGKHDNSMSISVVRPGLDFFPSTACSGRGFSDMVRLWREALTLVKPATVTAWQRKVSVTIEPRSVTVEGQAVQPSPKKSKI
jgi:hypothetical protein